jgi:hypothetical protein
MLSVDPLLEMGNLRCTRHQVRCQHRKAGASIFRQAMISLILHDGQEFSEPITSLRYNRAFSVSSTVPRTTRSRCP